MTKSRDILQQTEKNLQDLSTLIQQEQRAITKSDIDGLHDIIRQKNEILTAISAVEAELIRLFKNTSKDDSGNDRIKSIKTLLLNCREKNAENNRLAIQGINVLDKSIEHLESLMQIGSVKIYGPTGKTGGQVSKRNIGIA